MIPLAKPIFTEEMKEAAILALQNEPFVFGESVFKFEEEFAKYIGVNEAVSVSSGTFALSAALTALDLEKNYPITTTPMTFPATANAIVHAGMNPVFTDISEQSGCIDFENHGLLKASALVPVHLYGNPCNVENLEILMESNIPVIEDACQAHGAAYGGQKVGSIGDAGCFSFYSNKNMTVGGDGGMVTTNSEEIATRVRCLRDCGRVSKTVHAMAGYTGRLNTVNAAIGIEQLKQLSTWNRKRRTLAAIYNVLLPQEIRLAYNPGAVYHLYVIKTKKRSQVISKLAEAGISTGIHYPIPVHLQPYYFENHRVGEFPVAEKFAEEIVSLPMYVDLKKDAVKHICEIVVGALE